MHRYFKEMWHLHLQLCVIVFSCYFSFSSCFSQKCYFDLLNFALFFVTFLIFCTGDVEDRSNLTVEAAVCSETLVHNLTNTGRHIPHAVISMAISIRTSDFLCTEHREARANRRTLFTFLYRSKSLSKCTCIFTGNHKIKRSSIIETTVKRQLGHTNKLLTDWLTYLLTPWSRVLLENLACFQLVKNFPAFYGTRSFINAFTSARHLSLFWASSIQSITPHPTSWRCNLILCFHLRLVLPSDSLP